MPKVQKDSWANYQTVTYCSSVCNDTVKRTSPYWLSIWETKGSIQKAKNIVKCYANADCIAPLLIAKVTKNYTA